MQAQRQPQQLPPVLLCVTGKGPLKQQFQARMAASDLRRVACRTLWLESGDYPRLLGAADLGVCLHTSSSGLDLPMKVSRCLEAWPECLRMLAMGCCSSYLRSMLRCLGRLRHSQMSC